MQYTPVYNSIPIPLQKKKKKQYSNPDVTQKNKKYNFFFLYNNLSKRYPNKKESKTKNNVECMVCQACQLCNLCM